MEEKPESILRNFIVEIDSDQTIDGYYYAAVVVVKYKLFVKLAKKKL